MKKLIVFTLTLALVLSLAACGSAPAKDKDAPAAETGTDAENVITPAEDSGTDAAPADDTAGEEDKSDDAGNGAAGLANPMVSYDSLDEVNEIVGCRLCTPGVMGVTDKAYFITDTADGKIAEAQFTVSGMKYTFRSAPVADKDISGLWIGADGTAFEGMEISDEIQYAEDDAFKAARWFTIDGQYVLSVADNGEMDKDTFLGIVDEMRGGTLPGMTEDELAALYADMAGSYADTVSQRATAEVTANGSEGMTVVVSWSSSASETDQWTMEVRLTEEGLYSYPGESHRVITTDENGNTSETIDDAEPVPGWFEYVDDQLLWTGANSEQCRTCVFEKIPAAE